MDRGALDNRLISSIVTDLILKSGYMIKKIDYGSKFQDIVEEKNIPDPEKYLKDLQNHSEEYLLFAHEKTFMVKILFDRRGYFNPENHDIIDQGEIILVGLEEPIFSIANLNEYVKNGNTKPLEKFLKLHPKSLKKYKKFIKTKFR